MKTIFDISTMTIDELKEWRRILLFRYAYQDKHKNYSKAGAYTREIQAIGEELNKRLDTTKYLPR